MKRILTWLTILLLAGAQAGLALVCTPATSPGVKGPGAIVSASDWNTAVVGAYTYLNTYVANTLNCLTTKGDLYVYTGEALTKLAAGTDTYKLCADSSTATGLAYKNYAGADPLTTKGDLETLDSSGVIVRVPVGANGYALRAKASESTGLEWADLSGEGTLPKGAVVPWSPTGAGTTTIPAGWAVCDGTGGTCNLIGMFVLATRPNGSSATPATGGYGAYTCDSLAGGTKTHTHNSNWGAANSLSPSAVTTVQSGTGATVSSYVYPTAHLHPFAGGSKAVVAGSLQPSDYALIYLVKQ